MLPHDFGVIPCRAAGGHRLGARVGRTEKAILPRLSFQVGVKDSWKCESKSHPSDSLLTFMVLPHINSEVMGNWGK